MRDIRKIAKEYRNKNGNDRITNRDLLWYMIGEFDELKGRITKTETRQKMFIAAFPIVVGIVAIVVGLI